MKRLQYAIALALMLAFLAPSILTNGQRYLYPLKHEEAINKYSAQNQIDPALTSAIIYQESRFRENALSAKGARGLMQLMPATARWTARKIGRGELKDGELNDPETNIALGTWYLAYLLEKFGNQRVALAAYNGGLKNTDRWLKKQPEKKQPEMKDFPFKETRDYVAQVERASEIYRRLYPELE